MNRHQPKKSTTGMMFLFLLRMEDNIILPNKFEETTGLCFDCLGDGYLHIPSQPTCSYFYLYCYFNVSSKDERCNMYLSVRFLNKDSEAGVPHFKI